MAAPASDDEKTESYVIKSPYIIIVGVVDYDPPNSSLPAVAKDVENMRRLWFDTYHYDKSHASIIVGEQKQTYITEKRMTDELIRIQAELNLKHHRDCDALLFIFSGHGTWHKSGTHLICSDNRTVSVREIQDKFASNNCKFLAGKPKLFYLDCCRGENKIKTVKVTKGAPLSTRYTSNLSDFYTHFATCPDYVAWIKGKEEGSHFLYAVSQCFQNNCKAQRTHTVSVQATSIKINQMVNRSDAGHQVSEYVDRLTYDVYIQHVEQSELCALRQSRNLLKGIVERDVDDENVDDGNCKQTRTIIFVGVRGSGMTTLINSMINYLHRVGYDEQFRYNLTQPMYQGRRTFYTKCHLRGLPAIPFALNVIDPGFNLLHPPEGPEKVERICAQFKNFCGYQDRIDAIYFVIKSSDRKLCVLQKYIFNMVLGMFGNDVKNNIFIVFTFSDGAQPPALAAVRRLAIPFADYFQINNSGFGLLASGKQDPIHHMFFDAGMKQFEVMFEALAKVQPVSSKLMRETQMERDKITQRLYEINHMLKTALHEIDMMQKVKKHIEANKDSMDATKAAKFEESMGVSIEKVNALKKEVGDIIQRIKKSVNRLREIELNTEILTDDQYFDTWIQTEKAEQKPGWQERVERLVSLRERNKLLRDVTEKDGEEILNQFTRLHDRAVSLLRPV